MKAILLSLFVLTAYLEIYAQGGAAGAAVLETNKRIDDAVVAKDLAALKKLYADDFIFKHGTGTVDDKESWIRSVGRLEQKFVSRVHDSTEVELHSDIALVSGTLTITRMDGRKEVRYKIWYLRIFRQRNANNWELISHRTTREIHL